MIIIFRTNKNTSRCFRCFGNRRDALETEEDVVESSYILKRVHVMSSEAIQVPVFNLILWIFRPPLGKKISLTRSFGRKFNQWEQVNANTLIVDCTNLSSTEKKCSVSLSRGLTHDRSFQRLLVTKLSSIFSFLFIFAFILRARKQDASNHEQNENICLTLKYFPDQPNV